MFAPDENNLIGFSWEGSDSNAYVKTTGGNVNIRSGTTDLMTLLSTGEVGIGTASPTDELTVKSDGGNSDVLVVKNSTVANTTIFRIFETTAGDGLFSLFDEFHGVTEPGQLHRYALVYDRGARTLEWHMDGKVLKRETSVPDLGPSLLALGMMTEKDIVPGKGSVSCHGQGAVATWGGIRVKTEAP